MLKAVDSIILKYMCVPRFGSSRLRSSALYFIQFSCQVEAALDKTLLAEFPLCLLFLSFSKETPGCIQLIQSGLGFRAALKSETRWSMPWYKINRPFLLVFQFMLVIIAPTCFHSKNDCFLLCFQKHWSIAFNKTDLTTRLRNQSGRHACNQLGTPGGKEISEGDPNF